MTPLVQDLMMFSLILGFMGTMYPMITAAFFDPEGRMFPKDWEDVPANLWIAVFCSLQMPIVLIVGVIIKVNS